MCSSVSPLFLPSLLFSASPSENVKYHQHSLPPAGEGGWGGTAVVKELMPMFNRRWVQCVRGRGWDGRGRGEGRGWSRKLLEGGGGKRGWDPPDDSGGLGPAPTSPSTIHSLPPAPLPSRTGLRSPRPSSPSAEAGRSPQIRCHRPWHSWYQIQ